VARFCVDSSRRVRELADSADHVIPGHDPDVLRRYPTPRKSLAGIVARLDRKPFRAWQGTHPSQSAHILPVNAQPGGALLGESGLRILSNLTIGEAKMNKLMTTLIAATFAGTMLTAVAADAPKATPATPATSAKGDATKATPATPATASPKADAPKAMSKAEKKAEAKATAKAKADAKAESRAKAKADRKAKADAKAKAKAEAKAKAAK
jgi:outer membrane biosynthesis protein TonB